MNSGSSWTNEVIINRCDLDSHADTCCFGSNSVVLSVDLYHTADVAPFSDDLGKLSDVPIATVAVAYDCSNTFSTIILIFQQLLYIQTLTNNLLCPNQLRLNDVIVNECPLQFIPMNKRKKEDHSILIQDIVIRCS
jgi:hypothetical protein